MAFVVNNIYIQYKSLLFKGKTEGLEEERTAGSSTPGADGEEDCCD